MKHCFVSYLLVNEPNLPVIYQDETKVVPHLDDNRLYTVKGYQEKIFDFIEQKLLKERRFAQKTRLIEKDIEIEAKKRIIEQKKLVKKRFLMAGKDNDMDDEEDDEEEEKSRVQDDEVDIKADIENSRDDPGHSESYFNKQ